MIRPDAQIDHEGEGAVILRHDARALPLDDESVDLIVTSPPYFDLRSYQDACGTCGGGRIDTESAPGSPSSTLSGRNPPVPGDKRKATTTPADPDCLECHGTGRVHYDGQLGSEGTPAEFIANLIDCMREWVRVLKPSGSIFVNLGDKYSGGGNGPTGSTSLLPDGTGERTPQPTTVERKRAMGTIPAKSRMLLPHRFAIACIDELGLIVRSDMVWSKPNGLPESVTDRVRSSHEYWFHIVKAPRYFAGLDEIREPVKYPELQGIARMGKRATIDVSGGGLAGNSESFHPLGRIPDSVWDIPSEPLIIPDEIREARNLPDHFAAFPQEWPRRLILGWSWVGYCTVCDEPRRDGRKSSNSRPASGTMLEAPSATITGYACACPPVGDPAPTRPAVILDPFGGTGTTAGVARTLGRYGISNDLSADYNRLAAWRIFESGHFAKTEQRTWADKQGRLL